MEIRQLELWLVMMQTRVGVPSFTVSKPVAETAIEHRTRNDSRRSMIVIGYRILGSITMVVDSGVQGILYQMFEEMAYPGEDAHCTLHVKMTVWKFGFFLHLFDRRIRAVSLPQLGLRLQLA
jgi:hypothetical protein